MKGCERGTGGGKQGGKRKTDLKMWIVLSEKEAFREALPLSLCKVEDESKRVRKEAENEKVKVKEKDLWEFGGILDLDINGLGFVEGHGVGPGGEWAVEAPRRE